MHSYSLHEHSIHDCMLYEDFLKQKCIICTELLPDKKIDLQIDPTFVTLS